MPSLFNRRSRSVSTSRPTTSASSSAHLAAAQAFLASQPSQSNLSASAAAAALRTMSPAPTPVNEVQTKRMLNRQASNSSVTSASRGRSRGALQRRPSSGSMTERTFRSPSPGQQTSQTGSTPGVDKAAPPVPPLPQGYSEDMPPIPAKSHRRSVSVDTPPRLASPPLPRPAGRGQGANTGPPVSSLAAAAARRSTSLQQQAPEMKRSDSQESRNSFNFSYPRGSRPSSPPPRSPLTSSNEAMPAQGPAPSSKTPTNGISASEVARIQHNLSQVAGKPVKSKKKRVDPSAVEGSHLQTGTMGAKPTVTPLEPLQADYVPPLTEQSVKKPKKAVLAGESSHFPSHEASDSDTTPESPKDKRSLRASGVLLKQPSVVREDWEGEQEQDSSPVEVAAAQSKEPRPDREAVSSQTKRSTPAANMSRKIEDPSSSSRSPSGIHSAVTISAPITEEVKKTLSPGSVEALTSRGVSVSPSRSTRFSDRLASDLAAGRKHEPLGRSMSPAKSALKHTYAASDASPTDPRFPQRRGSSVTPSEASDVSNDGSSRKKSARVSFEGFADAKDSLVDVRTQKETNKKSWFGAGKGKPSNLGTISADEEVEEGMKPRPELPSFGSVRRGERSVSPNLQSERRTHNTSAPTKSSSSSETSSIADPPTMDTSISSDQALSQFLAQESQKISVSTSAQKDNRPLPPKVTSVEGTGYESDSESVYSEDERPFQAAQTASQQLGKSVGNNQKSSTLKDEIPAIAILPATPGLDEPRPGDDWAFELPGGFPASGTSSDSSAPDISEAQPTAATPVKDQTGLGLTGSTEDHSSSATRDTSASTSPQPLMTITEEDSDADSVYSDAAEEMEGDGFGSINAIIESPITSPLSQKRSVPPPESPSISVITNQRRPDGAERTASWDDTQTHWSDLAQRFRDVKQELQAPTQPTELPRVQDEVPVKAEKPTVQPAVTTATPSPKPTSKPATQQQSGPTVAARLANKAPPSAVVATKSVPAPKAQGNFRSSMRTDPEPVPVQPKQRPVTYAGPSSPPRTALRKNAPASNLSRTFSNDSDSDSSFRKARRNKKAADGKYTMRTSMRHGPAEPQKSALPAGRAGVRSLSPPVDRRPTSPVGGKTFRTTMRGSVDLGTPTLRPQPEKRSSSLFSRNTRNRAAKSPTRPAVPALPIPSKLKSRINDSDNEDGQRPTQYKSRFADSSDEDEPPTLRPVRGIPKRKDEAESTDLDDSSDEEARKAKATTPKKLTIVPPPPTQEVASPPLSPTTAKKGGLWSRLRGKKKEDEFEPNASNTILSRETLKAEIIPDNEESANAKNLGFGSAAERDALIEQTRLKLEGAKETPQSPTGRPQSPKLHRRMTPLRVFSDSYAPPKMPVVAEDRPQTADGIDQLTRPAAGSRQPTSEKINGEGAMSSKTGKKKKFGFLRKAFGLND